MYAFTYGDSNTPTTRSLSPRNSQRGWNGHWFTVVLQLGAMLTRVSEIILKRTSIGNLRVSFNQFVLGHLSEPDLFFSSHVTELQFYFLYLTRTSRIPPLALKLSLTGHIDTCCWNSPVCCPSPVTSEAISPGPFFRVNSTSFFPVSCLSWLLYEGKEQTLGSVRLKTGNSKNDWTGRDLWKAPCPNSLLEQGTLEHSGPCPDSFWVSLRMESSQPFWATCQSNLKSHTGNQFLLKTSNYTQNLFSIFHILKEHQNYQQGTRTCTWLSCSWW